MSYFASSTHGISWVLGSVENVRGRQVRAVEFARGVGAAGSSTVRTCSEGDGENLSSLWRRESASELGRQVLEEDCVVRHFSCQIQLACGCLSNRAPERPPINTNTWRVAATACMFLRRFYCNNSLLAHDPRVMVMACILLAGKVEESNVSMRELHRLHSKCKLEDILESELVLMRGINYQLKVFHPQSMIVTLIADLKRSDLLPQSQEQQASLLSEKTKEWHVTAEKVSDLLQLTVAGLAYAPLDVAVSALLLTQPSNLPASHSFDVYLTKRFGAIEAKTIQAHCAEIISLLSEAEACVEGREAEAALGVVRGLKASPLCKWGKQNAVAKKAKTSAPTE